MPDLSWIKKLIISGENQKLCRYWFTLQSPFCTWYTSLVHSFEPESREPNIEQELGPEIQQIADPFTAKVEAGPYPPSVIIEPDVLNEPESEVVELVSL